jgi:hypothetical protein
MSVVFVQDNAFALRYTVADDKIVNDKVMNDKKSDGRQQGCTSDHSQQKGT